MSFLEVKNVHKTVNQLPIVSNVHFIQHKAENMAIAGATGSGKTTLLKLIAGLLQPTCGEIFFENARVKGSEEQLFPGHKWIAYLNQHFELRNNYLVEDLLEVYNKLDNTEAAAIYELCCITHLLKRKTNELSGGERQRIALAIQLITKPKLLLLDEPFSNLDLIQKNNIKQVLENIKNELGVSFIITSHDWTDLLPWANTVLVMHKGEIIQKDNPQNIYLNPLNEYVAGLSGEYNIIDINSTIHFNKVNQNNNRNKLVMLRPEQIAIEEAGNIFQTDTIRRIHYYGSYYLVEVEVNHKIIKVYTTNNQFYVGQRVVLSANLNTLCYIKTE